jgi:hypothetical protein
MPAKDIFHETVKHALIKDGGQITHDPFYLRFGDTDFYLDLAAEPLIAATKNGQPIAGGNQEFFKRVARDRIS